MLIWTIEWQEICLQWFLHNISYCMWVALDSGGGFRLVPSSWSIDWNNQCLYWKVNIMIIFGIRNSVHVLPEAFQIQCFVVLFPQTMCGCVEARRLWLEVCDAEQFPISIASSDWSSLAAWSRVRQRCLEQLIGNLSIGCLRVCSAILPDYWWILV